MAEAIQDAALHARARRIEWLSIGITLLEAAVALPAGVASGSVALIAFGLDSVIEIASSITLLWSLAGESQSRERRAERALRYVGALLMLLAIYIAADSVWTLVRREAPSPSAIGLVVLAATVVLMTFMTKAKRKVARELGSDAMEADAKQSGFCGYLASIALAGVGLNYAFGWWWADPSTALIMVPVIAREGLEALRGETCVH
jgi:divalent metal cation (Fe/Co/Zn/Cd) transporter